MRGRAPLRILAGALALLHFSLHLGLGLGEEAPDLLTVALLLVVREMGMGPAAGLGFLAGLLEDSFSVLAFGANTLALTLVAILGARTRDLFVGDSLLFFFWYLAGGKWLRELVRWVVVGEGSRGPFVDAFLVHGTVGALYGATLGVLFLLFFSGRRAKP